MHVRVGPSTVGAGDGVFTLCNLPALPGGLRLTQYHGKMLEGHVRELFPAGHASGYVLQIRADRGLGGLYVDGEHSSHWSAKVQHGRTGAGRLRLYVHRGAGWLRTLGQAIPAGTELTTDYGSEFWTGPFRGLVAQR